MIVWWWSDYCCKWEQSVFITSEVCFLFFFMFGICCNVRNMMKVFGWSIRLYRNLYMVMEHENSVILVCLFFYMRTCVSTVENIRSPSLHWIYDVSRWYYPHNVSICCLWKLAVWIDNWLVHLPLTLKVIGSVLASELPAGSPAVKKEYHGSTRVR